MYQQVLNTNVKANDLSAQIIVEEWKGEVTEYIENYEYYRLSIPDIKEKWAQHYPLAKCIPLASISSFAYYIVKAKLPHHFQYIKERNYEDCTDFAIAEMTVFFEKIVKVLEENGIDPLMISSLEEK